MSHFNRAYELRLDGNLLIDSTAPRPLQLKFLVNQEFRNGTFIAEINIYNLSEESRQKIMDSRKKKILLSAGYYGYVDGSGYVEGNTTLAEIFDGVIINTSTVTDGKDTITTLFCNTAYDEYKKTSVEKSWGKNTAIVDVIRQVAEQFGKTVSFVGDFNDLTRFPRGYSAADNANVVLNELGRIYGFDWGLDNNSLVIVRKRDKEGGAISSGKTTRTRVGARTQRVDGQTLLMGKTEMVAFGDNYANANIATKLNPALRAYDKIEIDTNNAAISTSDTYYFAVSFVSGGTYTVLQVNHEGDFYGDTWDTTALCEIGGG